MRLRKNIESMENFATIRSKKPATAFGRRFAHLRAVTVAVTCCCWLCPASVRAQFPRPADEKDFRSIFDGRTLDGWSFDPVYWRVEDGVMVGEVTPETLLDRNTFIVWQGGTPENFELKMECRISPEGNSGINYRSCGVPDVPHALRGYQLDIDGAGVWTGQNYEERGREFLALRGQAVRVAGDDRPYVVGSLGEKDALLEVLDRDGWNEYRVIARGNTLIHIVNGRVMSLVVETESPEHSRGGSIGMQVHVGPPMKVEFRNIRLRTE